MIRTLFLSCFFQYFVWYFCYLPPLLKDNQTVTLWMSWQILLGVFHFKGELINQRMSSTYLTCKLTDCINGLQDKYAVNLFGTADLNFLSISSVSSAEVSSIFLTDWDRWWGLYRRSQLLACRTGGLAGSSAMREASAKREPRKIRL